MATIEDLVSRAFEDGKKVYSHDKNQAEESHHHMGYFVKKSSDNEVDITFSFRKPQYGRGIMSCAKRRNGDLHSSGYILTIKKMNPNEILMSISGYAAIEKMLNQNFPNDAP